MSERQYASGGSIRAVEPETQTVLKGLLRNLRGVRKQRAVVPDGESDLAAARRQGEIWGLDAAISAVERRIR